MADITIPPAALRAARAASMNALGDGDDSVKAACLAMLRAWPGMEKSSPDPWSLADRIILPITETDDD